MTRYTNNPRRDRTRAKILAITAGADTSAVDLATMVYLSRDNVNRYLKKLRAEKLVHIGAYRANHAGGQPTPLYRAGEGQDAVYVPTRANLRKLIVGDRLDAVKHLLRYKRTSADVGLLLGLTTGRARFYICELKNQGLVYISSWRSLPAGIAPVYALGNKPDAPKTIKTRAQTYAELMQRAEDDPELAEKIKRKYRLRQVKEKIAQINRNPQNIFSALGL